MPQPPDWNRYLDAGAEFVAMTRTQARKRAKVLVSQGQLAQEQVQGFVDDLVEESRKRTDVMLEVVRKEIQRQVKTLGIATKEDLARLETRIAKQSKPSKAAKATKSATKKKPASKKKPATSKRASSKKTAKRSAKKAASKAAAS
jgi:polyhydroxyalkanoate synthesis regulator phasin